MSHHYIQRRSVVFIVDTQFDSVVYRDKALRYVEKFYSKLDGQDHFGYISLNSPQDMTKDEIRLEHCKKNKRLKEKIIADIAKREIEYVFNYEEGHRQKSSKTIRLERALEKAYEWQNTLAPDFEKVAHGRTYCGPLKWIVCLLGDDIYSVNQFMLNHKESLARAPSTSSSRKVLNTVSISIMTLTSEVKTYHARDYRTLCGLTREGIYVNIVDRDGADKVASRFFSSMDVYPSERNLVIREYFTTI